jgi:hypothetical protein
MRRTAGLLFLSGTMICFALGPNPDLKQIERAHLRRAAERYAREHAGVVRDLRQPVASPRDSPADAKEEERGSRRCADCDCVSTRRVPSAASEPMPEDRK